jgi:hypothetical protein
MAKQNKYYERHHSMFQRDKMIVHLIEEMIPKIQIKYPTRYLTIQEALINPPKLKRGSFSKEDCATILCLGYTLDHSLRTMYKTRSASNITHGGLSSPLDAIRIGFKITNANDVWNHDAIKQFQTSLEVKKRLLIGTSAFYVSPVGQVLLPNNKLRPVKKIVFAQNKKSKGPFKKGFKLKDLKKKKRPLHLSLILPKS